MRGIVINPFTKTVSEAEGTFTLNDIYKLLDCDLVTIVQVDEDHDLFLDDEGLLKDHANQEYFLLGNGQQPFAGRGLILAHNDEGEAISATLDVGAITKATTFLDKTLVNPDDYLKWEIHIE